MRDETMQSGPTRMRRAPQPVWDAFVRLFHWALVASIAVAAVTGFVLGPGFIPVHVVAASLAVALVLARIVWGFAGGGYARFAGFVTGPVRLMRYARDVLGGREARHVGHNPLGAAMVLALMAAVLAAGLTGWAFLGAGAKLGPFAFILAHTDSPALAEMHEAVAFTILALVALHLGGVIFTSRREGENLVRAMVTGKKEVGPQDIVPPEREARPGAALGVGLALALVLALAVAAPVLLPVPGAPVAEIDPTARAECTDCHMFYHPSLLPSDNWEQIMATLDNHFGEDASLDAETTAEITAWLSAHAAESADTRASKVFRLDPAKGVTRISDTPFWKARHGWIDPAAFRSPRVGSRDNCAACHADAETGWFNPFFAEVEE